MLNLAEYRKRRALGAGIVLSRIGEGDQPTVEPRTLYRGAKLGLKAVVGDTRLEYAPSTHRRSALARHFEKP